MSKIKNLVYLIIFGASLVSLKFFVIDKVFSDAPKDASIWFTSGLLLVVLGIFITEKYFTRSLDVIVNVITVTIVLLMLDRPGDFHLWGALLTYSLTVGGIALISFILYDEHSDRSFLIQKIADSGSVIARFLGSSRMLFSIVFIVSIFNYFVVSIENNQSITAQQLSILGLIVFWGAMLLVEPIDRKLIQPLIDKIKKKSSSQIIGIVSRRIAPNVIVSEALQNAPALKPGLIAVMGNAQVSDKDASHCLMYLYSQETESKRYDFFYLLNKDVEAVSGPAFVHVVSPDKQVEVIASIPSNELLNHKSDLIGLVHTGSDINILKVKMLSGVDEEKKIKEGDLVSATFYGCPTKYQIINVETSAESVDGSNKQGGKIITAQQIGYWQDDKQKFESAGWVPEINAPVFIENASEQIAPLDGEYFRVGVVPRSKYPIYINLEDSVTHHIAIIGKTGTGKSYMAAKIIEKMAKTNYRIIIFEVDRKHSQSLTKYIDSSLIEEQDSTNFDLTKATKAIVSVNLPVTVQARTGTGTVNMSDVAADLIEKVIQYQVKNENQKICIAMEEAYDFIPESTFGSQTFGQPTVSRISQMVLKCRKHNIGFLIITQRTALVTKTILYQCHTIIALQSFDETSKNFMGAYINQKYLESMSILPRFRAIVVGKGSSCDQPVIVNFHDASVTSGKKEVIIDNLQVAQEVEVETTQVAEGVVE